ncbi:MAG: Phosphorylated carbohydrates phosphatase [Chlamydiae bacterium]|nr:Phosphorylated carbohydrates phosphatase [Chlamydiota bacterium]
MTQIRALFLDVGGVLLTNGWDTALRKKTAEHFNVNYEKMDTRHRLYFNVYEIGKLTIDEYLTITFFFDPPSFTISELKSFIFNSVRPYSEMIEYVKELKEEHGLKIAIVSNEGKELVIDRFTRFDFSSFVDFYIVSSFVGYRKPDPDIYKLAIDVAQIPPKHILYIDDRELLAEAGRAHGLQAIHHTDLASTKQAIEKLFSLPTSV